MELWTDDFLTYLQEQGEISLSSDVPCIFTRLSIPITAGIAEYELPEQIIRILRVTYKGFKVYAYSATSGRLEYQNVHPTSTSTGRPLYYIAHEYGRGVIRFFPTPNEDLSADPNTVNTTAGINSQFIISAKVVADPSGLEFRLPDYIRRRTNKYYVMSRAYAKEGHSQNMKASQYFLNKYLFFKEELRRTMEEIPRAVTQQMGLNHFTSKQYPRPILPPDKFGRIVE